MAKTLNIDTNRTDVVDMLRRAIQSANINCIIGSGCSEPALNALGNIEAEIQALKTSGKTDEAEKKLFGFICPFLEVTGNLINKPDENIKKTVNEYKDFLDILSTVIIERESNILSKQATLFSTNYDLFVEAAFDELNTITKLVDGFNRGPRLTGGFEFSVSEFFNSIENNGNIYNYRVSIPSINMIKLHGSLSWNTTEGKIVFDASSIPSLLTEWIAINKKGDITKMVEFSEKLSTILPVKDKFKYTVLKQTYYDLFRIYANALDRENTLLMAEGFSFEDEHIFASGI